MNTKTIPETIPVTNETSLLREQIASLEHLATAPPLTITVHGGGLPDERSLSLTLELLIQRSEVTCILHRLRGALAVREQQGW